jgi:hypothetical protein
MYEFVCSRDEDKIKYDQSINVIMEDNVIPHSMVLEQISDNLSWLLVML